MYDLGVQTYHKPLKANTPITIVDIDDESLEEIGRWPWSRNRLAEMVNKLYGLGATVIAFDILFSEPEKNIAEEVLAKIPDKSAISSLESVKEAFDHDALFAKSLTQGDSVLALVLNKEEKKSVGMLPTPLLTLPSQEADALNIPLMKSYLSNTELLEKSAKYSAFINSSPDRDGVLRFSPLVLRYKNDIYPSLGLRAAGLYLLAEKTSLKTGTYRDRTILEGIQLDQYFIPTDQDGRILIPFRGPAYTFDYVSAKDILKETVKKEQIANKIVFIGSSATGMGEIQPTAISPIYVGVEIHASIAAGILDHYLPFKPSWGKGATIILTFTIGMLSAFLLPRFGAITVFSIAISFITLLFFLNQWLLQKYSLVISVLPTIFTIIILYFFDEIFGYFMETKKRKELKSSFGLYVPPAYIDMMLKKGKSFSLEGETKELTVLFADIQNFTTISESLSAHEIKKLLNFMFNPITQIIFDAHGTIDKYVGDMIMAFWGAPLDNPRHAFYAVSGALLMLEELKLRINPALPKGPELHLRIGINTGMMNVGDMGSKFRRAYTVLGDSVNFASRLEGLCKYYHLYIMVGEKTWAQTKDDFIYRKVDKVRVKGKESAVTIYQPICPKSEGTDAIVNEMGAHHLALEKYQAQNWVEAEKEFKDLQKTNPENESLYQVYLDRITHYKENPPPPEWDGSYAFDKK